MNESSQTKFCKRLRNDVDDFHSPVHSPAKVKRAKLDSGSKAVTSQLTALNLQFNDSIRQPNIIKNVDMEGNELD